MTNIDWERVQAGLDREKHKMIWRPYGLPQIMDLETSAFHDAEISQRWDIPQKMIVSVARRPAAGRGLNVSYAHLDVTDEATWHAAVDHALDRLGGTSLVDRDSGAPGVGILHFGTAGCAAACRSQTAPSPERR